MANLLPKDFQKRLRRTQRARLLLLIALAALAAALIVFAALLPASITLHIWQGGSDTRPRVPALSHEDRSALQEVREIVFALKPIAAATTTPTQVLLHALSLKPPSVAIDHVTYTAGVPGTITLSGTSGAPSAINAYRASLAADPRFSSVSVPVNALIGGNNGRFTMTITGNF